MIFDQLSNAHAYWALGSRFEAAFAWLASRDIDALEPGKIDILPGEVHAIVQRYQSKPLSEGVWEAHRKYADIQYVHAGRELIFWERLADCRSGDYLAEKDFLPLTAGDGTELALKAGDFAVFLPRDAHKPGVSRSPGEAVSKVVVKVLVEDLY